MTRAIWSGDTLKLEEQVLGKTIGSAVIGNPMRGTKWELIASVDDKLIAYETNIRGRAIRRMPLGDLAGTGIEADTNELPFEETEEPADTALIESRDARGGTEFEHLAVVRSDKIRGQAATWSSSAVLTNHIPDGWLLRDSSIRLHGDALAGGGQLVSVHSSPLGIFGVVRGALRNFAPSGSEADWLPAEIKGPLRGFDVAADGVAIVTDTEVLFCRPLAKSPPTCGTIASPSAPLGPIAIADRTIWIALADGSVRAYSLPGNGQPAMEQHVLRPSTGDKVTDFLRAFPGRLMAGRGHTLAIYDTSAEFHELKRIALRPESVISCGENRWYALEAGAMWRASADFDFRRVESQPGSIRAIACNDQGSVTGVARSAGVFVLRASSPIPVSLVYYLTAFVAIFALGFGGFAVWRGSTLVTPPGGVELERRLESDLPKGDLSAATSSQRVLVNALKDFLNNVGTVPPLTIGIYGEWGSGKSTIMRMLEGQLRDTHRYVTVWFNAWRHQQEEQLGPALLQCVVEEFRRQATLRVRFAAWFSAIWASRAVGYWALAGTAATGTALLVWQLDERKVALAALAAAILPFWKSVVVPFGRLFTVEPAQAAHKNFAERIGFLQEFNQEFARVVGALPKNHFLTIFVDDLDRCPPDRVTDVVEALNRLMDTQTCFVILGMDPEIVRRCVEVRYESLIARMPARTSFGEQFLEKLVTIAVHVPPVGAGEIPDEVQRKKERWWERALQFASARVDQVLVSTAIALVVGVGGYWTLYYPKEVQALQTQAQYWIRETSPEPAGSAKPWASHEAQPSASVSSAPLAAASAEALPPVAPPAPEPLAPGSGSGLSLSTTPAAKHGLLPARVFSPKPPKAPVPPTSPAEERVTRSDATISVLGEQQRATRMSHVVVGSAVSLALLACAVLGLAFWRESVASRRIKPLKDSKEFRAELDLAAGAFANPRRRVRFRNLARLCYYALAEKFGAAHVRARERSFFRLLLGYVQHEHAAIPTEDEWLRPELARWLGQVQTGTIADPATAGTETHTSEGPNS